MPVEGTVTWEPAAGGFVVVVVSALGTKPTTYAFFLWCKIPKIVVFSGCSDEKKH